MPEYKLNEKCIVGLPSCGYGFASSRLVFLARPADDEFQLEEDIITQILKERNYDIYVALQRIDPGNFAFCTKICSKIITSHFCIILLNPSKHTDHPEISIPNPNVHFEYGMMLGFHKHVIPMQHESETLPFNIFPIDTIKYKASNFKTKAEAAIDDAILRFKTNEPPGRPIGPASNLLKYFSFQGMRYSDVSTEDGRAIFNLGSTHGFNLFDGDEGIVFIGYFHEDDPKEIVIRTRFLMQNINAAYGRIELGADQAVKDRAYKLLDQLSIELLVPKTADNEAMLKILSEYQPKARELSIKLHKPEDIESAVKKEYDKIVL